MLPREAVGLGKPGVLGSPPNFDKQKPQGTEASASLGSSGPLPNLATAARNGQAAPHGNF